MASGAISRQSSTTRRCCLVRLSRTVVSYADPDSDCDSDANADDPLGDSGSDSDANADDPLGDSDSDFDPDTDLDAGDNDDCENDSDFDAEDDDLEHVADGVLDVFTERAAVMQEELENTKMYDSFSKEDAKWALSVILNSPCLLLNTPDGYYNLNECAAKVQSEMLEFYRGCYDRAWTPGSSVPRVFKMDRYVTCCFAQLLAHNNRDLLRKEQDFGPVPYHVMAQTLGKRKARVPVSIWTEPSQVLSRYSKDEPLRVCRMFVGGAIRRLLLARDEGVDFAWIFQRAPCGKSRPARSTPTLGDSKQGFFSSKQRKVRLVFYDSAEFPYSDAPAPSPSFQAYLVVDAKVASSDILGLLFQKYGEDLKRLGWKAADAVACSNAPMWFAKTPIIARGKYSEKTRNATLRVVRGANVDVINPLDFMTPLAVFKNNLLEWCDEHRDSSRVVVSFLGQEKIYKITWTRLEKLSEKIWNDLKAKGEKALSRPNMSDDAFERAHKLTPVFSRPSLVY